MNAEIPLNPPQTDHQTDPGVEVENPCSNEDPGDADAELVEEVEPGDTEAEPAEEVDDDEDLDLPELLPLKALRARSGMSAIMKAMEEVGKTARGLDKVKREMCRMAAGRKLHRIGCKTPGRLLDAVFPVEEKPKDDTEEKAKENYMADVESWPEEVDGAELLDELIKSFQRWLILPKGAVETVALWVLFSHAHNAFSISPILVATSPQKQCGKSTLLFVLDALVPRPMYTSGITAATLFRSIESWRPTLLIDEADTYLGGKKDGGKEALRGCLNSGHCRRSAVITRCDGDDYVPTRFSTWSPKAIALIGKLPDTVEDRSLIIRMRRKAPSERTEELRLDQYWSQLEPVRRKAARWAADHMEELRHADPRIPDQVTNNRVRDNWRSLLAIADRVGGEWPKKARLAMLEIIPKEFRNETAGVMLLCDLHAIFTAKKAAWLYTEALLNELHRMEERPWPEWGRSKMPIGPCGISRLLADFDIKPELIRDGKEIQRGYRLEQLQDAVRRYVPAGMLSKEGGEKAEAEPAALVVVQERPARRKKGDVFPEDWPGHALLNLWLAEHPFWKDAKEPVKAKALPQLQQAVDELLRLDGRDPLDVQALFRWVIADGPNGKWKGWATVMRSPAKLRERTRDKTCTYWDLISQQMKNGGPRGPGHPRHNAQESWEDSHEI